MFERNKFLLVTRHCFIMHAVIKTMDLIDQEKQCPDEDAIREDIFSLGNFYFKNAPESMHSLHLSTLIKLKEELAYGDLLQTIEKVTQLFQSTNNNLKLPLHKWLSVPESKRIASLRKMIPDIEKCVEIDKCIRRVEHGWVDRSDLY